MNAPFVQLAMRVPAGLRRALRVHCVEFEVSVADFVAQAVAQRLERVAKADGHRGRTRVPRR
jgi:hypothetical protein